MLDVETYELAERLARMSQTHFSYPSAQNLNAFLTNGFPIRVSNLNELYQMIDSFHEGQLDWFVAEMGALGESDVNLLVDVIELAIELQLQSFPERRPIIPYAAALGMLCLYRKMRAFDPNFETVLEIGPGNGFLSYFLSRHRALSHYCQIEACQSLYLLQSLVGHHAFGLAHREHAFPDLKNSADLFGGITRPPWLGFGELVETIDPPDIEMRSEHFPWWRTGAVAKYENHFSIVTSNANLSEFSEAALHLYLRLTNVVLRKDGLFLAQGPGADYVGRWPQLPDIFTYHRFAIVAFPHPGAILEQKSAPYPARTLVDNNILLVKEGHPLFDRYFDKPMEKRGFFGDEPFVHRMFLERTPDEGYLPIEALKALITQRINARIGKRNATA